MSIPDNASNLSLDGIYDRLKGCIFGAALGDAIGLATEFLSKGKARELYGIGPISFGSEEGYEFYGDGHRKRWDVGDWTDDTDQQLLIIDSLIETNGLFNSRDFAYRLHEWANKGYPELNNKQPFGIGQTVRSVLNHPKFKSKPHRSAWDVWIRFKRNMAANGALMRTAILGVPFFWDEKQVIKQTLQATKVTHTDPRCCVSSIIVTGLISRLLKDNMQDVLPELDDETKNEILKWIQSGNPDNQSDIDIDSEDPPLKRSALGIDAFGTDPIMLAFTSAVVERYKFIVNSVPVEQQPDSSLYSQFQVDIGEKALMQYCFPESLASLKLDENPSIGYVYKCLGSALYCFTRNLSQQPSEGEVYYNIAMLIQIVLLLELCWALELDMKNCQNLGWMG